MPIPHSCSLRPLLATDSLNVLDWRCDGADAGGDEVSDGHNVIVTRRGAWVRDAEAGRTFADASTLTFANANETYRVRHPVPGGDHCTVFQLAEPSVRALMAHIDPAAADASAPRFPITHAPADGEAYLAQRLTMASANRAADAGSVETLAAEEMALRFLRLAARAAANAVHARTGARRRSNPANSNRYAMDYAMRVRAVVARRYREPLTLAAVAANVGSSPYHLARIMMATEGIPIHRLVLRLRLRDACEALLDTRDDISSIALAAGFASHSHLSEAFRREYSVTPSALRTARTRDVRAHIAHRSRHAPHHPARLTRQP
jgi:AraC family transcriptional regulator